MSAAVAAAQQQTVSVLSDIVRSIKQSTKKTYENCKAEPGHCFRQVFVDGAVLVGMYVLALWLIDGVAPNWEYRTKVYKYMALFVACSFTLRYMELDFADALSRGAAVVIAAKFVSALALPAVAK